MWSELDVDREAERTRKEEAMLGPHRRSGDVDLLPTRRDGDTHEVRVVLRRREALLGDLDAALGRDQRSVHLVHRFVDAALERSVQRSDSEQPRVVLGQRPVHRNSDARRPRARERHRQARQLRGEGDERAEHLELAWVDDRDVHRRTDDLAGERGCDLLGDDDACTILRLGGRSCEVRRDHHLRELEQRPGVRLRREDVERSARHLARANRVGERLLVDEPAPSGVDDAHTVLHLRERLGADEPARLVVQRQVECDEVGLGVELVEGAARLHAELAEALGRDERVVRDDTHPEPERAARHLPPDPPEAEDAERLAGDLDPGEPRAIPGAGLERGMRLRNVAHEREHECDRMLGRGVDRRLRGVRHDDPASRGCLDVDVVDADSGAPDDPESCRALDERRVERRRRADDDRVEVADDLREVGLAVLDDVEAASQQLEARFCDRLADENSGSFRHARRRGTPRALARSPRLARSTLRARRGAPRLP